MEKIVIVFTALFLAILASGIVAAIMRYYASDYADANKFLGDE